MSFDLVFMSRDEKPGCCSKNGGRGPGTQFGFNLRAALLIAKVAEANQRLAGVVNQSQ